MKNVELLKINNVSIVILDGPQELVPIKPICQILGVDESSQRKKINEDEILSSVAVLSTATGADGKAYQMLCIPRKFVYGWLFTISPKNINPEAAAKLVSYKLACYNALYDNFELKSKYIEYIAAMRAKEYALQESVRKDFNASKKELEASKDRMRKITEITFEQFKASPVSDWEIPFIEFGNDSEETEEV